MRIFRCDDTIKSYKFPILKIVLSVILISLIPLSFKFRLDSYFWDFVLRLALAQIFILTVLVIYTSFCEIILLKERKEASNTNVYKAIEHSKKFSIDHIVSLLLSNDIIDISIVSNQQIIKLGVASDSYHGSSRFFDKTYYIDGWYNDSIEEVKERLIEISINGNLFVFSIDGVRVNSGAKKVKKRQNESKYN